MAHVQLQHRIAVREFAARPTEVHGHQLVRRANGDVTVPHRPHAAVEGVLEERKRLPPPEVHRDVVGIQQEAREHNLRGACSNPHKRHRPRLTLQDNLTAHHHAAKYHSHTIMAVRGCRSAREQHDKPPTYHGHDEGRAHGCGIPRRKRHGTHPHTQHSNMAHSAASQP